MRGSCIHQIKIDMRNVGLVACEHNGAIEVIRLGVEPHLAEASGLTVSEALPFPRVSKPAIFIRRPTVLASRSITPA
jgi:hypothetical protein